MNKLGAPINHDPYCATHNCENQINEGAGYLFTVNGQTHFMCAPCMDFVMDANGTHSQIYRNAIGEQ